MTSGGIDWQREKWQSGLGSKFIHQGEKNAAKYADEVIVLSKGVQDYMKKYIFDMSLGWIIKVYLANLVAGVLAMCLFGNIVNTYFDNRSQNFLFSPLAEMASEAKM